MSLCLARLESIAGSITSSDIETCPARNGPGLDSPNHRSSGSGRS
jgi:hypothetical protein